MDESTNNHSDKTEQTKNENPISKTPIPKKSHKKRNILIALGAVFLLLIFTPILIAGYFGFVPVLSTIMGANQAKDLGVTYTQQDYFNYLAKTKTDYQDYATAPTSPENPEKKIVFADPTNANNLKVSQEELTAAINESNWAWMPIDNAQVKITDGTIEISGNMNLDNIGNFISFIGGVGYSQSDIDQVTSWAKKFVNNAPIYIKANGSVENDQLNLEVQEVQVGRYTAPNNLAQNVLATGTQNAISNTPGLTANKAELKNGELIFTGTHPTTIYVKTN